MTTTIEPPESEDHASPDLGDDLQTEEYVPLDDAVIGRAFRWSLLIMLVIAAGATLIVLLGREPDAVEESVIRDIDEVENLDQTTLDRRAVHFRDITAEAGIDFVHTNAAVGDKLLPETMGSGCAFFDYDADGDQDILLINAVPWPDAERTGAEPTAALYRNDGTGRFTDATAGSGLDVPIYGCGVAVGDYDNDGDVDVFIAALGANRLFRNTGGMFEDVTTDAGVAGADIWSTSAGFFDYDNDGDLDLFVCNYVRWSRETDFQISYTLDGTSRSYGPPLDYGGTYPYLYRNDGDGTFTDVSAESGVQISNRATGAPKAKSLAISFVDIDDDGWLDVFVANDTVDNFLLRNLGDGTFEEAGLRSGVAVDSKGETTGAMGSDFVDFRNDGTLGGAVGNFSGESSSFFVQQDDYWYFVDMADLEGIGSPSRLKLSFGVFFFDYDLDGWLDLLQTNGHLEEEINTIQPSQHYLQSAQLFWNRGPGADAAFAAVPEEEMGDLAQPIAGRGAAYADIDGDGDLDVLLTQTGAAPLLLRNEQALGRHWLRLKLRGTKSNRDAIGALIEVEADGFTRRRTVMPTKSYLSQVELPVTFGLGDATVIDRVRITWPSGIVQELLDLAIDRVHLVEEYGGGP